MCFDAGAAAVAADPAGFARVQWDTWSPPGWFDDAEFAATARAFANPDWLPITLNAYRSRFLADEPHDDRYAALAGRLAATERITVPTLMIQGGDDRCDHPAGSEGLEPYFTGPYERLVIDRAGHFPHREVPEEVANALLRRFASV